MLHHEMDKQKQKGIVYPEEEHHEIVSWLDQWGELDPAERSRRNQESGLRAYKAAKNLCVRRETMADGTVNKILLCKPDGALQSDFATYKQCLHIGNAYDLIMDEHLSGTGVHLSAGRTHALVKHRYSRVPKWVTALAVKCCPICSHVPVKKKTQAGHTPLITRGFSARGQVDLIDFQANPDGEFKWMLNYVDHGIKLYDCRPLRTKSAAAVAAALVDIFTFIGPPKLLQADNGAEFRCAALKSVSKALTDEEACIGSVCTHICVPLRVLVCHYAYWSAITRNSVALRVMVCHYA